MHSPTHTSVSYTLLRYWTQRDQTGILYRLFFTISASISILPLPPPQDISKLRGRHSVKKCKSLKDEMSFSSSFHFMG